MAVLAIIYLCKPDNARLVDMRTLATHQGQMAYHSGEPSVSADNSNAGMEQSNASPLTTGTWSRIPLALPAAVLDRSRLVSSTLNCSKLSCSKSCVAKNQNKEIAGNCIWVLAQKACKENHSELECWLVGPE